MLLRHRQPIWRFWPPTSSKCSNKVTATGGLGSLDFDIIEFNNVPTILYPTCNQPREVVQQQVLLISSGITLSR
jgi:hypothetical protein